VRSVICVLVIVPALAFALTRFFEIRHEVEVALVALAISPVPPLLPMKETKAGGRISYGLGLLALLALLSMATIPGRHRGHWSACSIDPLAGGSVRSRSSGAAHGPRASRRRRRRS
jgi:hypothetical protein